MGAAFFYHLTQAPLEVTLPMLIGKARGAGWTIEVRGQDQARMAWLDEKLWQGGEDAFLPHGLVGGPHDAWQPVLLTTAGHAATPAANNAACLMAVDGADVTAAEVGALERVCILFDGNDPDALNVARGQWKSLTDAGCAAQYWSKGSGRWEKKAERGG